MDESQTEWIRQKLKMPEEFCTSVTRQNLKELTNILTPIFTSIELSKFNHDNKPPSQNALKLTKYIKPNYYKEFIVALYMIKNNFANVLDPEGLLKPNENDNDISLPKEEKMFQHDHCENQNVTLSSNEKEKVMVWLGNASFGRYNKISRRDCEFALQSYDCVKTIQREYQLDIFDLDESLREKLFMKNGD